MCVNAMWWPAAAHVSTVLCSLLSLAVYFQVSVNHNCACGLDYHTLCSVERGCPVQQDALATLVTTKVASIAGVRCRGSIIIHGDAAGWMVGCVPQGREKKHRTASHPLELHWCCGLAQREGDPSRRSPRVSNRGAKGATNDARGNGVHAWSRGVAVRCA